MKKDTLTARLSQLPSSPGIYLFFNIKRELIYVGKATSLNNRVKSYFRGARTSRPIEQMIHTVEDIKWIETDSVLEAIILEGTYIKKYRPKYNIDWKDDKSWNYIVITNDTYPRVLTIRQHELDAITHEFKYVFGPFPGLNTKATMRLLSQLFYISSCTPKAKRPCLYYQMGQCLGVCTGNISATEYKRKVIQPLIAFLKGGKKRVLSTLKRRMKKASKEHDFEEAARLRDQINKLQRIHDIALLNKSFISDISEKKDTNRNRIEGYDISNLGATGKVGSMVVAEYGEQKKSDYRKFKIKTVKGQSDVDCLDEVIRRRLKHSEWPFPALFLIDGGKPQVNRVVRILKEKGIAIPVVGIAKGKERKKNEFIVGEGVGAKKIHWIERHKVLLTQVRDEAHRFAISYQRKLRKIK
ncbi:MAG: GIY-YIG nuclease family protein [Candidatus Magasanikbacteria bacterium]|nr:GIY-YIG nuclease family protein [Candidatus Magasanikbacteria bacterium]